MKNLSNKILIGVSVSLAIAFALTLRSCHGWKQEAEDAGNYITASKDTLQYLRDSSVAQRKTIEADASLFKTILEERDDLRKALKDAQIKPKNVGSITTAVSHSTIAPGHDSIIIKVDSMPCPDFGPVPFSKENKDYYVAGNIENEGITITKLDFPDSLSIILFTDHHLFRKSEHKASAHHSNQYLRVTGLESIEVRQKNKLLNSRWLYLTVGVVGGYFLFK